MKLSMAWTSPVMRASRSPSRRLSGPSDSVRRCPYVRERSWSTNRSPIHAARYSSMNDTSPPRSASPTKAAASQANGRRSPGTSTSSTSSLKNQTSTAAIAGTAAMKGRLRSSQPR
jgi:hypothetical protein